MRTRLAPAIELPVWSRVVLALIPLRESRGEVEADFTELFVDRQSRYGRWYAHRRLSADIVSLWRGTPRGGHVFQDLRFGMRLFRKHPLPVGLAVLGLALAIGVVTAVFTLVNATMLKPFGMDDPASIVQVNRSRHKGGFWESESTYTRFLDMRGASTVSAVEASMRDTARLSTTSKDEVTPERTVRFVSGGFLQALGGRASFGRTLTATDDQPEAPPVVVLSHWFFESELLADPQRLGATIWIDGAPATIVGVLEEGFTGPTIDKVSAWAPFASYDDLSRVPETYTINGRTPVSMTGAPFAPTSKTLVEVIARLAPGVSMAAAEENIASIVHRAETEAAGGDPKVTLTPIRLFSKASPIDGPRALESYIQVGAILGLVGLVLAVACANTANLLLAAAATRTREIGVRLALGATRRRLLAQMVTESLTLGLAAGALGFICAVWLSPLLGLVVGLEPGVSLAPDGRVLAFAIGVAILCGVGAGIAPARYGARGHLLAALQSQSAAAGRASLQTRLRASFIGFQAAVSMLLLVAAALFARMALHMNGLDVGYDANRVLTASITVPQADPKSTFDEAAYFRGAIDAVRAIPSVERVALIEKRPFGPTIETLRGLGDDFTLFISRSDAEFFPAAGIRLVSGRFFTEEEVNSSAQVAVIGESVARRFYSDIDPLGQPLSRLPFGDKGISAEDKISTIVGVVDDALLQRTHTEYFGMIHRPMRRLAGPKTRDTGPPTLIVRTAHPAAIVREVEDALRHVDSRARPSTWILQLAVNEFIGSKRMMAWLAIPMAAFALLLAALGIYGVSAFVTRRRMQEVSVRMAMGASAVDVLKLLVRDGLRPVVIGLVVGLACALGAGQVFSSMFVGVGPTDPLAIALSGATLVLAALVAVLIPARHAARVDPASILRES